MLNSINKYVAKTVCVIMLLLIQFDVCAPLIDTTSFPANTTEKTLPADDGEETPADDTYYFHSSRAQVPNIRLLACTLDALANLFPIPQVLVQTDNRTNENIGKIVQPHIVFCVYRI